jgi:signal transduction histidine kinase
VVTQDITEQEDLRKKKERLEKFTSIVSHDLRNPLNVARGQAGLAREDCDSEHLDAVVRAHERMETLIDDLLVLAQSGRQIDELAPVALRTLAIDCWDGVVTDEATLETATDRRIRADRNRLRQVLKNLFRDAVVHGGSAVTVTIGQLADGFYVEDDGPGIPADDREQIFDAGYSTARDGTGFGLSIVEEIADAHDWSIRVTEGADGGARFEVTDVASADAAE